MSEEASLQAVSAAAAADTLRLLTCGSVDDGKSTLIGRLLYDSHLLMEDQVAELERDSKKHGTAGDDIDFALLVDGLEAEREQGITIDVAYRFFATPKRRFIIADTPGHVQYTRNMSTGASTADLAILLAVNKMDFVGLVGAVFRSTAPPFTTFAANIHVQEIVAIPISARAGANV